MFEELQGEVNQLRELVYKLIGVVKDLDTDSEHSEYCMARDCFRCGVAWGLYDL